MKTAITVMLLLAGVVSAFAAESSKPDWAYAVPVKGQPALPRLHENNTLYRLPGTKLRFTRNAVQGLGPDGRTRVPPADWFPAEHPRMPKLVAEGDAARKIVACALCHSPLGRGRSQNAALAGLPASYISAQLQDMQRDLRRSAEPRKENAHQMIAFAKAMTGQEIREAAAYYGALRWTTWMRVVETDTVPKMASADGMWLPLAGNAREPIGNRLIETPTDAGRTDLRDPHSGFTAYVPRSAVEKGRRLVVTGGGKTRPCAICHGANLTGLGRVPGIASRSPSYVARQLYDIQSGARRGSQSVTWMRPVVARLSAEDILNIAAYTASLAIPGK